MSHADIEDIGASDFYCHEHLPDDEERQPLHAVRMISESAKQRPRPTFSSCSSSTSKLHASSAALLEAIQRTHR
ncbi:hypothetical protein SKC41_00900 [Mycobacterium sp. 050128]|uniref:hypothetical protein n=1 Tax=Mycobacterium sp. 050128 TaxID=3096112 RepID=UPI002ED77EB2